MKKTLLEKVTEISSVNLSVVDDIKVETKKLEDLMQDFRDTWDRNEKLITQVDAAKDELERAEKKYNRLNDKQDDEEALLDKIDTRIGSVGKTLKKTTEKFKKAVKDIGMNPNVIPEYKAALKALGEGNQL